MPVEHGSYERNEPNYQAVAPQAVAPPVAAARINASTSLLMKLLLSRGTNGKTGYTPFEGRAQVFVRTVTCLSRSVRSPLSLWVGSLALITGLVAAGLVVGGYSIRSPWVVLGLGATAALAERGRIRLTRYLEESISLLPTLFAAVVFGPLAAMVVAAASMIGAFGRPYMKWATYTSTRSLTGAATGLAATFALGTSGNHIASIVIATTIGSFVSQVLDGAFAALTLRVRNTGNPRAAQDSRSTGLSGGSVLRATCCDAGFCLSRCFALDATALLWPGAGCTAPVRPLSGGAPTRRGVDGRQHSA